MGSLSNEDTVFEPSRVGQYSATDSMIVLTFEDIFTPGCFEVVTLTKE